MFKKIAALGVLILASSASFAAQPNTFYGGVDVGTTKIDGRSNRETSVGAFAGYNFHQNFAVEAGYRRLSDVDYDYGSMRTNVRVNQTSLSLVGSLPVGESVSIYGRLGANRLEGRVGSNGYNYKDSDTKALYGVGVSYAFTPTVSGRVELQRPGSEATNLSAGVAFQF